MAHAVESMMSVGESPWHGLGRRLQSATFDEGLRESGLDWRVRLERITTESGIRLPDMGHAVIRATDNRPLGIVGPKWRPLQNREAFDWFRPFADSGECTLETAGSLHDGRIVWVMARIVRGESEVVPGDTVQPYILLSNSHDGSTAVRVGFTPIRVVCSNTLAAAHSSAMSQLLRVRHTSRIVPTMRQVRDIIDTTLTEFRATEDQYRRLARCRISRADLTRYVTIIAARDAAATTPQERTKIAEMERLAMHGRGNDGRDLTYWSAYNGVTEYLSWQSGRTTDSRFDSLWFGVGPAKLREALEIAVSLAS